MNRWKLALTALGISLAVGASSTVMAQQGGGGGGGGGGGRGNFDPAAFRAQQEARMKESLGVNDEEWKVLQPKIQKVTDARQAIGFGGGGGGGFGGRGGRGGGGAATDPAAAPATSRPANPVADARRDLATLLANKDSTPEQIKAKLDEFRKARDAARDTLKKAQDDLKSVCTARQEAVFVSNGTLE